MSKALYSIIMLLLVSTLVQADSIRIGNRSCQNVYIGVSKAYYYVHHPKEGRLEKVSRRRSDISEVIIDTDEARRTRLLDKYEATRSALGAVSEAGKGVPTVSVDVLNYRLRKRMKALAVFESQLDYWQHLSEEEQQALQEGLSDWLMQRTTQRITERKKVNERLLQLDSEHALAEQHIASAAWERREALRRARAESDAAYYLQQYERTLLRFGPIYYHYSGPDHDYYAGPYYEYYRDESLYDAAIAEKQLERERVGAVERDYAQRVRSAEETLRTVEKTISQRERDLRATASKLHDEGRRYDDYQARIDALIGASRQGYRKKLAFTPVATWRGVNSFRTETVSIGSGLWRVDCTRQDFDQPGDFSITVFDADSGKPFTRISRRDFLGMRTRVFDKPGSYYLLVEQDINPIPYEVTVSSVSEE